MKDEYIIINRTALEKRIEELKRSISICILPEQQHLKDLFEQELEIKTQILSQSTPLIPEIEKFARGEEAKWAGLQEWLSQQQGSVSKADIQKYLKDNRIQVAVIVTGKLFKQIGRAHV